LLIFNTLIHLGLANLKGNASHKKHKKFFLISQVFYPDEVSTAGLFTNLCSVIVEDGYEVVVWSAQPSYSSHSRQPKSIIYKGIKIFYLFSTKFPKDNIFGRFINILTFSLSAFIKLLLSRDKEAVFTHTTPPPLGIIISFVCSIRKRKFVYILHDIFPEGLIRLGKVKKGNLLIRFWHILFIAALKKCDRIIVIGRDMQIWLGKVYPDGIKKIENIPLWQDDRLVSPSSYMDNEFVKTNNLSNKFVIQYSGNMGLWNEMETIGKAVQYNPENVVFMFVGGGVRMKELLRSLSSATVSNTLFLPFQPSEKLGSILGACHVALVSLRDGLEGMAVPSKIYGILAAGKPVIAMVPENSEIAFVVKEENCGFVIEPTDVNGLISTISLLKSDQDLINRLGKNSRSAFERKYTTRAIAERYKDLIHQLS
jgi:colanic acid biosynthesis glycosyl transferase WcaI